jgi:hypothetical protein
LIFVLCMYYIGRDDSEFAVLIAATKSATSAQSLSSVRSPGDRRRAILPGARSSARNGRTTSRRFSNEISGPSYAKPKGGAPKGNKNALKHGCYSAMFLARRARFRALRRSTRELIAWMKAEYALRRVLDAPTGGPAPLSESAASSSPPVDRPHTLTRRQVSLVQRPSVGARGRLNNTGKQRILSPGAPSWRKPEKRVLTRKQNQPRTISRVSDLFGRDSRQTHGESKNAHP